MTAPGITARLSELGITLPVVPEPIARFRPFRRAGNIIYLAGQVCEWNGSVTHTGALGQVHDLAAGQAAARVCGLNLIAALQHALGDLDKVDHCVRLGGFVHCVPQYDSVPHVINGASDLMVAVFGEAGEHCRTAVGVASLPRCAAVEVDAIFAVKP
ncbi:RidA family protein [Acuticoccus sp. MNP-M23]|uniref:RidA family protein n=1 Tax=Acuticoccus sp. MNP-M23 TaxID=3072793 RepID=UPI002814F0EB|nr:RidA family protein [Acuticoccus sp. MNP-M23]WMS44640.1 RidA family protein [Acuticoccus sp. MNP-M23]